MICVTRRSKQLQNRLILVSCGFPWPGSQSTDVPLSGSGGHPGCGCSPETRTWWVKGVGCAPAEDVGRSPLCYACGGWVHPDTRGRSGADEPVRSLNDALKPKPYYAYNRYAGTYLMYAYVE